MLIIEPFCAIRVHVAFTRDEFKEFVYNMSHDEKYYPQESDAALSACFQNENNVMFFVIGIFIQEVRYIAHEASHIATMIMEHLRIEDDEFRAYIVGYITEQIILEQTDKKESDKSRYTRDANGIVTDHTTGLMWQDNDVGSTMYWENAVAYSENLSLGGYTDWRLPTIKELKTLVDYSRLEPAIDTIFQSVTSYYYWSSTAYAGDSSLAWVVDFSDGDDGVNDKSNRRYVRCVRAK